MLGLEAPPPFHSELTGEPHPSSEVFFKNPDSGFLGEVGQTEFFSFVGHAAVAVNPIVRGALGSDLSAWTALGVLFGFPASPHSVITRTEEWCVFHGPVKPGISAAAVRALKIGNAEHSLPEPCASSGLGQSISPAADLVTP